MKNDGYFEDHSFLLDYKQMSYAKFYEYGQQNIENNLKQKHLYDDIGKSSFSTFNKIAVPLARTSDTYRKQIEYTSKDFNDPFKFAADNLFTTQLGFKVSRNVFFYGTVRKTFQRLFEAGLLKDFQPALIKMTMTNMSELEIHEKQQEYSTLTWNQLYPGFYMWLVALIICVVVFFGEILVFKKKSICLEKKIIMVTPINR